MNKKLVAKELLSVARDLVGETDPMASERLAKMYLQLEKWTIKTMKSRPSSAPISVQLMENLVEVQKRLRGKPQHGREAVEAMIMAMSRLYTVDAPPLKRLWRKYGDEVEDMLYKARILP